MKKRIVILATLLLMMSQTTFAQETEIKLTLNEQFFETLLTAVFENLDAPKVPLSLAENRRIDRPNPQSVIKAVKYQPNEMECDESVRLKKQVGGVMTAVKFRNGKIYAPIAFEGSYNPPLIGCIDFSGWAETTIDLVLDKTKNALVGRAKVLSVNLSGTNGIGSNLITGLVQNSIDKKVNPIEIINLERLSFTVPIQDAGKLKMRAIGIRHVVRNREIDVYLKYRFEKAD